MGPNDTPKQPTETPQTGAPAAPPDNKPAGQPSATAPSPAPDSSSVVQPPAAVDPQSISIEPSHQPSDRKKPSLMTVVAIIAVVLILGFVALLML